MILRVMLLTVLAAPLGAQTVSDSAPGCSFPRLPPSSITYSSGMGSGEDATVKGLVLNVRTLKPLAEAMIIVSGPRLFVSTDTAGRFRIPKIRQGEYELTVRLIGFSSARSRVTFAATTTVLAALAPQDIADYECVRINVPRPITPPPGPLAK